MTYQYIVSKRYCGGKMALPYKLPLIPALMDNALLALPSSCEKLFKNQCILTSHCEGYEPKVMPEHYWYETKQDVQ